jgi:hypothetical protein
VFSLKVVQLFFCDQIPQKVKIIKEPNYFPIGPIFRLTGRKFLPEVGNRISEAQTENEKNNCQVNSSLIKASKAS